ncbi:MAG: hypothetical protein KIT33_01985 [Candidatus Kapabacteria bacterium]|nr:hypothetical protein [Ignavibacteriota bacterium]MCW5883722.1 hypothetical protein [Candidatus Kapabacteria bacterium]
MNILLVFLAITVNFEVYAWFNLSTSGITTNDFITLFLIILFVKTLLWDGREIKLAKNPAILLYFTFLAATFISGIYPLVSGEGELISQYMKTMIHFHFTAMLTIIIIFHKFENDVWNKFIQVWLILSIFINIFGVYQIIARAFDLPFAWIDLTNAAFFSRNQNEVDDFTQLSLRFEGFFRATSFFSEPSALGAFNGITLAFAIIPRIKNFKMFLRSKLLNNVIIILSLIGLMLAFSLTGVAIVLLMLLTVFITERLNLFLSILKYLPLIIIFVFLVDFGVESYSGISLLELFGKRFGTLANLLTGSSGFGSGIDGESVTMRGKNFTAMMDIWQSSPLFGIGLGLTYYSPYSQGWAFSDSSIMAVLAELGLVGAIPYILLFATLYIVSFKILRVKQISSKLDHDSGRLISISIYIMSYLIVTNFVSANNLISAVSAIFIGFVISVQNNYYIDIKKDFYSIKIFNSPLKEYYYLPEAKKRNILI